MDLSQEKKYELWNIVDMTVTNQQSAVFYLDRARGKINFPLTEQPSISAKRCARLYLFR